MATRYDLNVRALDVVGVAGVVTVTCQLCDSDHDPVVGYTDDGEIVDRWSGYTDSDGELTLSLVANSAVTPANTYYSLRVGSRRFLVEKGTSTETVQEALAGSPAELASALTLDQLSDVYAPSPSNGQALIYDSGDSRWEAQDVATQAELDAVSAAKLSVASNLSDAADAATAFENIKQAATTDATGVVELATTAETQAGADSARAVTPAGAAAAFPLSEDVRHIVVLTQAAYDALTPDADTLYVVVG